MHVELAFTIWAEQPSTVYVAALKLAGADLPHRDRLDLRLREVASQQRAEQRAVIWNFQVEQLVDDDLGSEGGALAEQVEIERETRLSRHMNKRHFNHK